MFKNLDLKGRSIDGFKRLIVILIGAVFTALGASLYYVSGLGVDCNGVFNDALAKLFNIEYGTASTIVNVCVLIVLLIFRRKYVWVATVVNSIVIGPIINIFNHFFFNVAFAGDIATQLQTGSMFDLWWLRAILVIGGPLFVGIGVGLYISMEYGASTIDGMVLFIKDYTHKSYQFNMFLYYAIFFVIGALMGGTWGVGTVLALFGTGPVFQFVLLKSKPFFNKYLKLNPDYAYSTLED